MSFSLFYIFLYQLIGKTMEILSIYISIYILTKTIQGIYIEKRGCVIIADTPSYSQNLYSKLFRYSLKTLEDKEDECC